MWIARVGQDMARGMEVRAGFEEQLERFFDLLRGWTDAKRYGAASTSEFRAFAAGVAGVPLDALFDAWLWDPELPPLPPPASR